MSRALRNPGPGSPPPAANMDLHIQENYSQGPHTVAVNSGGKLTVNACGRTVQLDMQFARSLVDLQKGLQIQLQMEAQTFHFFDVTGNALSTDSQVHDAIANGKTPLCATLTDASIHFIENRREELAQMQWKLVRDQMTAASGKMAAIGRQANDNQANLHKLQQDSTRLIDEVRNEALRAVESERDVAHCEVRQLAERVNAIAQLVNSERQKRETALQGVDKQFVGMRDMLDKERDSRRHDMALQVSMVQELKALMEGEKSEREAMKDKHVFDIHTLMEKSEAMQRHMTDLIHEQQVETAKSSDGWQKNFQGHVREVTRVRSEFDASHTETRARYTRIEERCASLENRMTEMTTRQAATVERLAERHEKVAQALEALRHEEKQNQSQVNVAFSRLRDLQASIEETEEATQKMVLQEQKGRADQLRGTHLALQAENKRHISELTEKMSERFERESSERERNVREIVEEVSKKSPKPAIPIRSFQTTQESPMVAPPRRSVSSSQASPLSTSKVEVMTTQSHGDSCYSPSVSAGAYTLTTAPTPMAITGSLQSPPGIQRATSGGTMTPVALTSSLQAPPGIQRTSVGGASSPMSPVLLSPTMGTRTLSRVTLPAHLVPSRSASCKRL